MSADGLHMQYEFLDRRGGAVFSSLAKTREVVEVCASSPLQYSLVVQFRTTA